MAKKVEGWTTEWAVDDAIRNGSGIELRRSEIKPLSTVKATLVIGDERVFTESEVRAILRDLLAASEDGPFMPNYDRMDEMVRLHGLSFDPA